MRANKCITSPLITSIHLGNSVIVFVSPHKAKKVALGDCYEINFGTHIAFFVLVKTPLDWCWGSHPRVGASHLHCQSMERSRSVLGTGSVIFQKYREQERLGNISFMYIYI
jgi:hypothetical protein